MIDKGLQPSNSRYITKIYAYKDMRDLSAPSAWGLSQTAAECAETNIWGALPRDGTRRPQIACTHKQQCTNRDSSAHSRDIPVNSSFNVKKSPHPLRWGLIEKRVGRAARTTTTTGPASLQDQTQSARSRRRPFEAAQAASAASAGAEEARQRAGARRSGGGAETGLGGTADAGAAGGGVEGAHGV